MKHLLLVAAVVAAAPAAMASKARVNALGNSRQIVDFQTAFDRPYQFMALGTQATIEWGSADTRVQANATTAGSMTAAAPHAEGGFLMKSDDMAYGVYLGRRSQAFNDVLTFANIANMMREQNPINVYYASKFADWTWGVTAKYSNGKDEVAGGTAGPTGMVESKASSTGLALGASNGTFDVELVQGISGKSEFGAANVIESKGMTQLTVGYHINENMEAYGTYGLVKADIKNNNVDSQYEKNAYSVGFVNTVLRNEDANFFYGVAFGSEEIKDARKSMVLPVWMGIEANANSWMVVRASVKQNVVLNQTELKSAAPTIDGKKIDVDSIAFNAGVGFKLGKGMLDATFGTANQGHLSFGNGSVATEQFLSNVAYTYTF